MTGPSFLTFKTVRIRVPETGEVRIPDDYAHEFASLPMTWTTVRSTSKAVEFPVLDPAARRVLSPEPTCRRCDWLRTVPWQELIVLWSPGWEPTREDGEGIRAEALREHAAFNHPGGWDE